MKVHASVRALFDNQLPLAERLKMHVDEALQTGKPRRWHYESRLKELQSFAVKIESGRVSRPEALEDFLACSIVVPNGAALRDAVAFVKNKFAVKYQRPKNLVITSKQANAFPFDDLRLYCSRENDGARPEEPIDQIIFEVQIKTFLQHAWGIATHDLSYKTEDVRWGKDRIVAHLKAAIEFAEISIQQAENLSHGEALQLRHEPTATTIQIIRVCRTFWDHSELPENLRGLAETIRTVLSDMRLKPSDLFKLLKVEKRRLGTLPSNLSPYGVMVELLLTHHATAVDSMLRNTRAKSNLLLTPEMTLPAGFLPTTYGNRIVMVR